MFAMYVMVQQGHDIEALVSIVPQDRYSWVFHTPNLHMLPMMAEAMGLRSVTRESTGEESSDLLALKEVLSGMDVDGIVTGAIASDYQWDRINDICEGLGLRTFSPMWRRSQDILLSEIIASGIEAVIVSVSAEGLDPSWLGKRLDLGAVHELKRLAEHRGINIAGEGGEYETMVLDSPMHKQRMVITGSRNEIERDGGQLIVTGARLEAK